MVCLYGTQQGQATNTAAILQEAQSIGARVDEVCVALYYDNANAVHGLEPTQQPLYQSLDTDQIMDFFEYNSAYGQMDYPQKQVSSVFPTYGYGATKLIGYEGSASQSVPDTNGFNGTNYFVRRNAVRRHPRMYGIMLNQSQVFQNAG